MRIGLCTRGSGRLSEILHELLPEDEIFECAASEVVALAADAEVIIPIVARIPAQTFASSHDHALPSSSAQRSSSAAEETFPIR